VVALTRRMVSICSPSEFLTARMVSICPPSEFLTAQSSSEFLTALFTLAALLSKVLKLSVNIR
jgi:hypothetical protein